MQRHRQLMTRKQLLRIPVPGLNAADGEVTEEELWHYRQKLREERAALSVQTCVAPITLMLHPEVCTGWGEVPLRGLYTFVLTCPCHAIQVFGRTFEFFKTHRDLAAPLDPSRDVTKKAGHNTHRVRKRRMSVLFDDKVVEVSQLNRVLPEDVSADMRKVYKKIKATSLMLQERGKNANQDDYLYEKQRVAHLTSTDQDVRLAIEIRRISLVLPLIDGLQVLAARKALRPEALAMRTLHISHRHGAVLAPTTGGGSKRFSPIPEGQSSRQLASGGMPVLDLQAAEASLGTHFMEEPYVYHTVFAFGVATSPSIVRA